MRFYLVMVPCIVLWLLPNTGPLKIGFLWACLNPYVAQKDRNYVCEIQRKVESELGPWRQGLSWRVTSIQPTVHSDDQVIFQGYAVRV